MTAFTERFPEVFDFTDYVEDKYDIYPLSWITGGIAGGNCWDEGGHYSIGPDPEPEFDCLDAIFEDVYSSLTFLQYRRLLKANIVTVEDNSYSEYYGNYTSGNKKRLNLENLYVALAALS